ncbi:Amidase domain-containing protein [Aphelenchoides fujianensis]|nr:Amidase domain-containing protein [Aphelenchoides fujianensis]
MEFGHREDQLKSFNELLTNSRTKALNNVVRKRIFAGNFFNLEENKGQYFLQAAKVRRLIQRDFSAVFREQRVDVLLLPSTNHSAPTISQVRSRSAEENQNEDFFTQSANMCGLPAISLPFGHCSNGIPLGVQLIGGYLDDWKCLELGRLFQAAK